MGPDTFAITRRTATVFAISLLSGCIGDDSGESQDSTDDEDKTDEREDNGSDSSAENDTSADGETENMGELTLTSPAFEDGERIPEKYGYDAENVNPPLEIQNVPERTESLALIMDDPDAVEPAGKVWDHWVVWNIQPEQTTIPEDWNPEEAKQGTNDFDTVGYGGPSPPDREHEYRFELYALETTLDLPSETDADGLRSALEGDVIEQTQLYGTYPVS
ncbi:MAG: YbhB/YbcL family Raf kinase inhibitor-like protein [Natronomonas sp.]